MKYTTNEIYLDMVEEIDCTIDPNGMVVTQEINGNVTANCRLTGMPGTIHSCNVSFDRNIKYSFHFLSLLTLRACRYDPFLYQSTHRRGRVVPRVRPLPTLGAEQSRLFHSSRRCLPPNEVPVRVHPRCLIARYHAVVAWLLT